jgi:CDP-glycerol glycerophosphotransferase (TagB/SpsB family)
MTVERTDILKTAEYDRFYFQVLKNPDLVENHNPTTTINKSAILYESRTTILDRPTWRDDQVSITMNNSEDEYVLRIVGVKKQGM